MRDFNPWGLIDSLRLSELRDFRKIGLSVFTVIALGISGPKPSTKSDGGAIISSKELCDDNERTKSFKFFALAIEAFDTKPIPYIYVV